MSKRFTPKSRRAWRSWLQENHASEPEVWLVFFKRNSGKPTLTYDDAVEEAICFGWIDGLKRRVDDQRYTHRFTPRRPGSKWSKTNRERVARMTQERKLTAAGRAAVAAAKRDGTWLGEAHTSTVEADMPDELAVLLARHPQAGEFFASLAPSYQRQFTLWINVARRDATRQKRIAETLVMLLRREKLGMR